MIPGGWEVHSEITSEVLSVYNGVKDKLKNGTYTPLSVATQSVGGKNYCFICKVIVESGKEYFAKVAIRVPYSGEAEFQSAKEILL